jgi:tetratricopeptide (TPR) repeat protein
MKGNTRIPQLVFGAETAEIAVTRRHLPRKLRRLMLLLVLFSACTSAGEEQGKGDDAPEWWLRKAADAARQIEDPLAMHGFALSMIDRGRVDLARELIEGNPSPEFKSIGYLRLVRKATPKQRRELFAQVERIAEKSPDERDWILVRLAEEYAALGREREVEEHLERITEKILRTFALQALAGRAAEQGYVDLATKLSDGLKADERDGVLVKMCAALVRQGKTPDAERMAARISGDYHKASAALAMAAETQDQFRRARLIHEARRAVGSIDDDWDRGSIIAGIAHAYGDLGELAAAVETVLGSEPADRADLLMYFAFKAKDNGNEGLAHGCLLGAKDAAMQVEDTDRRDEILSALAEDLARFSTDEAEQALGDIGDELWLAVGHARFAAARAKSGKPQEYEEHIRVARALIEENPDAKNALSRIRRVVYTQAWAGDIDGAMETYRPFADPGILGVPGIIARAAAEIDKLDGIPEWIEQIKDPEDRAEAYLGAAIGLRRRAERKE